MKLSTIIELAEQVSTLNDLEWDEIEVDQNIVTISGNEYIIMDQEEIMERMKEHIRETASYFNPDFLSSQTELPEEVFNALIDKNEAVYQLIEKTCGIEEFIEEAVAADGLGHFLNSYNGEEYELKDGLSAFNY